MTSDAEFVTKALRVKRESKDVDFKEAFDTKSDRDWVEVIKDVVAMANSGGGVLVFGVKNDVSSSGFDPAPLLELDPAVVTDKVATYTGEQFSDFWIEDGTRDGSRVALLVVRGVRIPMTFRRPGTYAIGQGRQGTSFAQGTVYFRHGAKSEPGSSDDLRASIEREVEQMRSSSLGTTRIAGGARLGFWGLLQERHREDRAYRLAVFTLHTRAIERFRRKDLRPYEMTPDGKAPSAQFLYRIHWASENRSLLDRPRGNALPPIPIAELDELREEYERQLREEGLKR